MNTAVVVVLFYMSFIALPTRLFISVLKVCDLRGFIMIPKFVLLGSAALSFVVVANAFPSASTLGNNSSYSAPGSGDGMQVTLFANDVLDTVARTFVYD